MKKVAFVFAAAVAALFAVSCERENVPANKCEGPKEGYTLRAAIENSASKATLDGKSLIWSKGDQIGVYVNDESWTDKNQPFTLDGDGGSATGDFKWNYESGNFTNQNATVAFFPWNGNASTVNNVYGGTMYFKMYGKYENYTSGQMLTPLVAKMSYDSESGQYNDLAFKYLGGAIRVSIANVPGAANELALVVDGKDIHRDFDVDPQNAGNVSWEAYDGANNTVYLQFATAEADRAFDFIFPVPTLTNPSLTFQMKDKNGVVIWKKSASNQPSIERAGLLDFSDVEINAVPRGLYLAGNINGADVNVYNFDNTDFKFKTDINGGAKYSMTLTSDSYVFVSYINNGTNLRFLPSQYVDGETSAMLYSGEYSSDQIYNQKIKVPAGEVEFTVTYNTDGTLNLSYVSTPPPSI